ncbi:MAG TPA: hypothetical protein VGM75_11685 [Pseudonocardiaceae bacterium]|jgi:hypothetical protein
MSGDQDLLVALLAAWRRDIDSEPFRHAVALRDLTRRWAAERRRRARFARNAR